MHLRSNRFEPTGRFHIADRLKAILEFEWKTLMRQDENRPDPDAVNAILLANHRRFLSFLEARVGNRHDAEEILQGVMCDLYRRPMRFAMPRTPLPGFIACFEMR